MRPETNESPYIAPLLTLRVGVGVTGQRPYRGRGDA